MGDEMNPGAMLLGLFLLIASAVAALGAIYQVTYVDSVVTYKVSVGKESYVCDEYTTTQRQGKNDQIVLEVDGKITVVDIPQGANVQIEEQGEPVSFSQWLKGEHRDNKELSDDLTKDTRQKNTSNVAGHYCSNCGNGLSLGDNFCSGCGAEVEKKG